MSKLQQVFTRFLAQAQVDAVCVEPQLNYTMLLLLVLDVSGKNDAKQWCLAFGSLQIENIIPVWMVLQQVDKIGKDLVVPVM